MPREIEKTLIGRYGNPQVVDHLASNYALGLLSPLVKQRLESLKNKHEYMGIEKRISYWEQKLSPLNNDTPELAPLPETWQHIQNRLNIGQTATSKSDTNGKFAWIGFFKKQWPSTIAISFCVMMGIFVMNQPMKVDSLSYVAVLANSQQVPQVVASTYGNSKKLVLDIVELPTIEAEQTFELWVTSKTDNQTRSLGQVPTNLASFQRQLSQAEWRLIVDSSYLIISVEDEGGSAIGEPSEMVISKGLCIRLSGWEEQT